MQKKQTKKQKHTNDTIHFGIGSCWLGLILVASSEKGICAILLGDTSSVLIKNLKCRFPNADCIQDEKQLKPLIKKVIKHTSSPSNEFDLPLDTQGTSFQKRVWKALRKIPCGTTSSYLNVAKHIGKPESVRAVAQACGANPLAIVVPCHRVIKTDGSLSGYRWGIERKRSLLEYEKKHSNI